MDIIVNDKDSVEHANLWTQMAESVLGTWIKVFNCQLGMLDIHKEDENWTDYFTLFLNLSEITKFNSSNPDQLLKVIFSYLQLSHI